MKYKNWFLVLIFLLVLFIISIALKSLGDAFDFTTDLPLSSEKELKENFVKNELSILTLKNYFNSIVPKDYEVRLEFKDRNHIDLSICKLSSENDDKTRLFQEWDIDPYNYKFDSLSTVPSLPSANKRLVFNEVITLLKWNPNIVNRIKQHLDKANCISITNGTPTNIGFKRSGMGMYFYNVFDKSLNERGIRTYNDSCKYRFYNEKVILEYGGGVIGPQCFPDN